MNALVSEIQAEIIQMIECQPNLQPTTKAQYIKAITHYLATGASPADAVALSAYAATLPKSSRSFLKAAIRIWGDSLSLKAKASATPENIGAVQATVYRLEALNKAIANSDNKGQKAHIWLSQAETRRMLDTCDTQTLIGQRDRVVLGLLVGAGLRREELAGLTFKDIVALPANGKRRVTLNIRGKGAKERAVPINHRLAEILKNWGAALSYSGPIVRSVSKGGIIGGSLSAVAIFRIVNRAGTAIGKLELAPHDLRRTYAELGFEAGVSIVQISMLLGHESIVTTQRYLGRDLDLNKTVSDFIPF